MDLNHDESFSYAIGESRSLYESVDLNCFVCRLPTELSGRSLYESVDLNLVANEGFWWSDMSLSVRERGFKLHQLKQMLTKLGRSLYESVDLNPSSCLDGSRSIRRSLYESVDLNCGPYPK